MEGCFFPSKKNKYYIMVVALRSGTVVSFDKDNHNTSLDDLSIPSVIQTRRHRNTAETPAPAREPQWACPMAQGNQERTGGRGCMNGSGYGILQPGRLLLSRNKCIRIDR